MIQYHKITVVINQMGFIKSYFICSTCNRNMSMENLRNVVRLVIKFSSISYYSSFQRINNLKSNHNIRIDYISEMNMFVLCRVLYKDSK